ncbi:Uncharacterised protein [uncultured archaeon]|nr:Uncharacterised protein [uncultured archaeon]
MPDEISHLLWTYLLLKHPRIRSMKDFATRRGRIAFYFFTFLPDLGNLTLILTAAWIMTSNGLPFMPGPSAQMYPQVRAVFDGPLKNVYYIHHSYVTLAALTLIFYVVLKRVYWPLVFGMGLHITMDIFTHKDATALKPFFPLWDVKTSGVMHWGSFEFYVIEIALMVAYTVWLFRKTHQKAVPDSARPVP